MFASELDNAERVFHVSNGRPPGGYFCLVRRKGDRHAPRLEYKRNYMRSYRKAHRSVTRRVSGVAA